MDMSRRLVAVGRRGVGDWLDAGMRRGRPWRLMLGMTRLEAQMRASSERVGGEDAAQRDGFEVFFVRHQQAVYGYLLRMTADEQAARDLSQETFLRAWQRFERIRAYEAPLAWLLRVATNLALTHLRRRALPVGSPRLLGDDDDVAHSDPTLRVVELDAVEQALLALTPKQRAALVLREVYGLSCDEVGQTLRVSRDAAKMLLLRGRERFRARYEWEGR